VSFHVVMSPVSRITMFSAITFSHRPGGVSEVPTDESNTCSLKCCDALRS